MKIRQIIPAGLRRLLSYQLRLPTLNQMFKCLFYLGMAGLCYLVGAAVMYFQLPTSNFLRTAFWEASHTPFEKRKEKKLREPDDALDVRIGVAIDKPGKTFDGFTLITTTDGPWAALVDMKGQIVHRWQMPFHEAAALLGDQYPVEDDSVHWFGFHLFPNGDLLAIYHAIGVTPYGYGLIKLDKDSKLLWGYGKGVHHEIDVADDGSIYALTQKTTEEVPEGVGFPKKPYIADELVILSPSGKELVEPLPILGALRNSKYSLFLTLIDQGYGVDEVALLGGPKLPPSMGGTVAPSDPAPPPTAPPKKGKNPESKKSPIAVKLGPKGLDGKGDYTHANGVRVVNRKLAPHFPLFKEGQVLVSIRNLDALVLVDMPSRSVVWAARGLWRHQHSPQLLDNGRILLFDNIGSSTQSRVLEYDPVTQAIPWYYANENSRQFKAPLRGMAQRLPNENTLFSNPDRCQLIEVTQDKEVVWDCVCLQPKEVERSKHGFLPMNQITAARRYDADQLTFLKGVAQARPPGASKK